MEDMILPESKRTSCALWRIVVMVVHTGELEEVDVCMCGGCAPFNTPQLNFPTGQPSNCHRSLGNLDHLLCVINSIDKLNSTTFVIRISLIGRFWPLPEASIFCFLSCAFCTNANTEREREREREKAMIFL